MGFFDKFLPKKEDSLDVLARQAKGAFDLSRQSAVKLLMSEKEFFPQEFLMTNMSRMIERSSFEILLLNTVLVFRTAPLYLPNTYFAFKRGYLAGLEHEWKQLTDPGHDLSEILENRTTFYTYILEDINDENTEYYYDVLYTDLASKFFEDPLALNHKRSTNMSLAQRVTSSTRLMVKDLHTNLGYLFEYKS